MGNKKKILFIVNPISGQGKGMRVPALLEKFLDRNLFEYEVQITEYAGHSEKIIQNLNSNACDIVVAVGGDGTFNELGSALMDSSVALGIIPIGSGNGIAGDLGIPINIKKAIKHLNKCQIGKMDVGIGNGRAFFATVGVGFDADVAHQFALDGKRGLKTYFKIIASSFLRYQEKPYTLSIDGQKHHTKVLIVCVSNGREYGNKAQISPNANRHDGLLNVVVVEKMKTYQLPFFLFELFKGNITKLKYVKEYLGEKITIHQQEQIAHLDGEPAQLGQEISLTVKKGALKIFC